MNEEKNITENQPETNQELNSVENHTHENTQPATENVNNDSEQKLSQEELLKNIESLNQQLASLNDKYIRLLAEFDNFKKRTRKEKEELIKYAGEEIWKNILPLLDDFERAMKENQNTNDIETIKKGFELIYNKIKKITQQNNITAIDCLHKDFNADIMEAVAKIPAPSEDLKGKVVDELEKAYQLNDKIIRFAKVVVAE